MNARDLENYIKNKKLCLEKVEDFAFDENDNENNVGYITGQTYPALTVRAGPIQIFCCVDIATAEIALNFYRLHNFLELHHLKLEQLPYDHEIIRKFNPFCKGYDLHFTISPRNKAFLGKDPVFFELDTEILAVLNKYIRPGMEDPKFSGEIFVKHGRNKWLEDQEELRRSLSAAQSHDKKPGH